MATRLEEQGALQRAHGNPQTTRRRLRCGCRIRLHDGSSRAAVRAETAGRAEDSALNALGTRATKGKPNENSTVIAPPEFFGRRSKPRHRDAARVLLAIGERRQNACGFYRARR